MENVSFVTYDDESVSDSVKASLHEFVHNYLPGTVDAFVLLAKPKGETHGQMTLIGTYDDLAAMLRTAQETFEWQFKDAADASPAFTDTPFTGYDAHHQAQHNERDHGATRHHSEAFEEAHYDEPSSGFQRPRNAEELVNMLRAIARAERRAATPAKPKLTTEQFAEAASQFSSAAAKTFAEFIGKFDTSGIDYDDARSIVENIKGHAF